MSTSLRRPTSGVPPSCDIEQIRRGVPMLRRPINGEPLQQLLGVQGAVRLSFSFSHTAAEIERPIDTITRRRTTLC